MKYNKKTKASISWNKVEKELKKDRLSKIIIDESDSYIKLISPIIKKREELGLSQRDLADICELPQSTIARIETMATTANIKSLIKITKALGLKITIS